MSMGGFGAGFAQVFDGAKFGRALNEGIADYREGKAIKAAEQKKAEAIKKLDTEKALQNSQAEAIKNPNAGSMEPQAIPVQGAQSDLDVDAVSSAAINPADAQRSEPMRQTTYDSRMAEINNTFENEKAQARADYYRFRGMNKEQEEAEKKLKNMQFAQKFGMLHKNAVDGDPEALGQLVGYMNASMGNGMQIKMGEGGKMSMLQNGKVIQENFTPTRAQIDQAAAALYNTARFLTVDGDFDKYMNNLSTLKTMDLADKRFALDEDKHKENMRHNKKTESTEDRKLDQAWAIAEMDNNTKQRGQTLTHAIEGAKIGLMKEKWAAEQAEKAKLNGYNWTTDTNTGEEILRGGGNNERYATKQNGVIVPDGMTREQVISYQREAKKMGATYDLEYFEDPRTKRSYPRMVFRVGDSYADTPEEAKGLYEQQKKAAAEAQAAEAQAAKAPEPANPTANVAGGQLGTASKPAEVTSGTKDGKPRTRSKIEQEDDERVKRIGKWWSDTKRAVQEHRNFPSGYEYSDGK